MQLARRAVGCRRYLLVLAALASLPLSAPAETLVPGRDYHTLANIDEFRVRHLELELQVLRDLKKKQMAGSSGRSS